MTPTTLAETILRDVPRYDTDPKDRRDFVATPDGGWLNLDEVLAALTAALTAALDPALSERAGEVLEAAAKAQEWMRYPDDAESISLTGLAEWVNRRPASVIPALVSVAQSLLAQIAALRTGIEQRDAAIDKMLNHCEATEERANAAEAVAEKLRGAAKADADLLFDAYKGLMVLRKMLDVAGLKAGVEAADSLMERIETAHPEMPGRSALRAALPARGVGVKPLVWLEDKDRDSETFTGLIASPMKGFRYVILQVHGGAWKLTGSVPFGLPHFPTLEAAKAAAQVDYEARILAALAPTDAAHVREAVLKEAVARLRAAPVSGDTAIALGNAHAIAVLEAMIGETPPDPQQAREAGR